MRRRRLLARSLVPPTLAMTLATSLLTACGSDKAPPPPPQPPVLDLTATGGADQNPGGSGGAAPVQVQLYQLADTGAFERADVFALADRARATLGDALLGSETFALAPGETRKITRDLKPDTRFIGMAVLFRDIDRAVWRATAPAAPHGPTRLALATKGLTMTLAPRPDGSKAEGSKADGSKSAP